MRFEDDFDDLPRRLRIQGVSPAWRIVAILSMIAAGFFMLVGLGLGVALLARPAQVTTVQPAPSPFAQNQPPVMQEVPPFAVDEEPEPPNPPYPLAADLQQPQHPGDLVEPADGAKKTARDRFVQLGQRVWSSPQGQYPQHPSISPDGNFIAYLNGQTLMLGPVGGVIEQVVQNPWNFRAGQLQFNGLGGNPIRTRRDNTVRAVGNLTWSDLGRYLYFADVEGRLHRFELQTHELATLPFQGDSPVPIPLESNKLIFRRSRATSKLEMPGAVAAADPSEIVVGDIATKQVRVLIPESQESWTPLSISPDGKRLALVSDRGTDKKTHRRSRLFLLDLTEGKPADPRPITPPCASIPNVCWELDSVSLIYARSQEPMPPDCWESHGHGGVTALDLFRYDIDAGRETRLSRGGGFDAPVLASGGNLFFLTWKRDPLPASWHLFFAPISEVLKFSSQEPDIPGRDRQSWAQVMENVVKEAGLSAVVHGEQLTPEVLAKLVEGFPKAFRERFNSEPPTSAEGLERLHRELGSLELSVATRRQAMIVLGACQGEYLRRRYGAVWRHTAGPLLKRQQPAGESEEDSPFALVFNPFEAARIYSYGADDEDDDGDQPYRYWFLPALQHAQGRPLVLANDPAEGKKAVRELTDPDLARGIELLQQNKAEEAERLLLSMFVQKKHEKNGLLALQVGKVLYEHKRHEALRQLMEPRVREQPADPHKYNLLGLALLDTDPKAAIPQFRNALRCNLYFGSAYLNMAQAYQNLKDPASAALCLKRHLKLMPYTPMANDARQRLAVLLEQEEDQNLEGGAKGAKGQGR
jgi:Tol biopolymer transport system component/tetratricopeptide (TPR) repeat protein